MADRLGWKGVRIIFVSLTTICLLSEALQGISSVGDVISGFHTTDEDVTTNTISGRWTFLSGYGALNFSAILVHYSEVDNGSVYNKVTLPPDVTNCTLGGLRAGTSYFIVLQAVFMSDVKVNSTSTIVKTHGLGPDETCNCDVIGAMNSSCRVSGSILQCYCHPTYTGHTCQLCDNGFFRRDFESRCQECHCLMSRSSGDCAINEAGVEQCSECLPSYVGHFCESCAMNHYWAHQRCVSCDCNGHENQKLQMRCTDAGDCLGCLDNTTGSHCELCRHGFSRESQGGSCVRSDGGSAAHHKDHTVLIAVSVTLVLIGLVIGAVFAARRFFKWRRRPFEFWTIELRDGQEDGPTSGVSEHEHNTDSELLMEDMEYYYRGNETQPKVFRVT